jgi:hypothetical protein
MRKQPTPSRWGVGWSRVFRSRREDHDAVIVFLGKLAHVIQGQRNRLALKGDDGSPHDLILETGHVRRVLRGHGRCLAARLSHRLEMLQHGQRDLARDDAVTDTGKAQGDGQPGGQRLIESVALAELL